MGIVGSKHSYNPDQDIPDLSGKVIIVTGGNTGVGYHTVKALVTHDAKVYMASRNESRATGAIAQLTAEGALDGKGQVEWLKLDLSSPESINAAVEEFQKKERRLDVLVNNAGVKYVHFCFCGCSFEALIARSHVGPFIFTTKLLPLLKETAAEADSDVRIVNVASSGHATTMKNDWKNGDWNWKSVGFQQDIEAYGSSKLANMLTCKELQRRLDEEGVPIVSTMLHPGTVYADGGAASFRNVPFIGSLVVAPIMKYIVCLTPEQGAHTSLFAATSPMVKEQKDLYAGAYLVPFGTITKPSAECEDLQAAKDCWETTDKVVKQLY
ncbi:hypothetical protein M407DRAFT_66909 [Tulasnella calospora MUT 4182]|uniref:NAD(P)-binding protein n=1 Tax=Tulasnella calospora MUT 4182 TaxID=1051891 RepID=A0A0C3QJ30_9AGAM|nr:hypothetical protein M407DRAFT_66909 [Tulasnella calospora MUT 4182]